MNVQARTKFVEKILSVIMHTCFIAAIPLAVAMFIYPSIMEHSSSESVYDTDAQSTWVGEDCYNNLIYGTFKSSNEAHEAGCKKIYTK